MVCIVRIVGARGMARVLRDCGVFWVIDRGVRDVAIGRLRGRMARTVEYRTHRFIRRASYSQSKLVLYSLISMFSASWLAEGKNICLW